MWWRLQKATIVMLVVLVAQTALGQDPANLDEINRKYQDALSQLQAAQDRKNELVVENEQLKARLVEVEKQLEEHKRQSAEHAQQTFFLRAHYAAWESFIQRYPRLSNQWRVFMEGNILAGPAELPQFQDPRPGLSSGDWRREAASPVR